MVILNNEKINDAFNYLKTIEKILINETNRIEGDKAHLDKIVPKNIQGLYSKKFDRAKDFSDNLKNTFYESCTINLLAVFENIVFAKYKTTVGTIRGVVSNHSVKPLDYFKSRERFIKDDLDGLQSFINLLEGYIDTELFKDLKRIKEQRDFLAHGKRFDKIPPLLMTIDDVAAILDKVISEIES
jgi:hypothetical protein